MNRNLITYWNTVWNNRVNLTNKGRFYSNIYEVPDFHITWKNKHSRRMQCVISRLRMGHVGVGAHMNRFEMRDSNICDKCR